MTNDLTSDIPGLNLLPPKWQHWVFVATFASPFIGRFIQALISKGGVRGVLMAIWGGTNTDKKAVAEIVQSNNIAMAGIVNPSLPVTQSQTEILNKKTP